VRKYEAIWLQIKRAGEGRWVDVKCDPSMTQTIINMVQNEKSEAQKNRKMLKLPKFGKLKIDRSREAEGRLRFTLINSGDSL